MEYRCTPQDVDFLFFVACNGKDRYISELHVTGLDLQLNRETPMTGDFAAEKLLELLATGLKWFWQDIPLQFRDHPNNSLFTSFHIFHDWQENGIFYEWCQLQSTFVDLFEKAMKIMEDPVMYPYLKMQQQEFNPAIHVVPFFRSLRVCAFVSFLFFHQFVFLVLL